MAQKKIGFFSPHVTPLTHLQKHLLQNTFPEVQLRIKDKKHLAHLKKNNHGILPAISCLVLGFHPTPKVPIFPPPSWSHPGPIPFIRDPGPNPNPMILPHVLELNGSKKLPNLSGGISCWVKKGHPFGQMMICRKKSSRMYVYYLFIFSFFKVNGSS